MNIITGKVGESLLSQNVGGKAAQLFLLKKHGLNIPQFVVILPDAFSFENNNDSIKVIDDFIFPKNTIDDILKHFDKDTFFFAVRSSATAEDGIVNSFAGQFETKLFVKKEQLLLAIKEVWKSAFSKRVQTYIGTAGITLSGVIPVIIQQMIDSDCAGVAFGINPLTGNRSQKVINAVYGVGEGLVSGELSADEYITNNKTIQNNTVAKLYKFQLDTEKGSGIIKAEIEKSHQLSNVLSIEQILFIDDLLNQLYKIYKQYQDIEFTYKNGIFYLLQSRPVTTVSKLPDVSGKQIIWDNSNIIESYPALTSPLTFSFIIKMYEAVYIEFSSIMGISKNKVEANADVFENMLGLLNGRVYYNLNSWFKALSLLPGYSLNAPFMEKMMGVKEKFEIDLSDHQKSGFKDYFDIVIALYSIIKNHNTVKKQRDEFILYFNAIMLKYNEYDFSNRSAEVLMKDYQFFEQTLVKKWKAPLVNDFFAMIYFGVLQKLVVAYKLDEHGTLHNELLSGANDIISTEPVQLGLKISEMVLKNEKAKQLFTENEESIIWKKIHEPEFHEILAAIKSYLNKWGERIVGELKLESITYSQNPESYIRVIKSYVLKGLDTSNFAFSNQENLRMQAEEKVNLLLKKKPIKKLLFNYVLSKARYLVSNRENLRYERTRGFGMVRKIFVEIGNKFYANHVISHSRDIFYLTKEEIFDFIKGSGVNGSLKEMIALRKQEYENFQQVKMEERFSTFGMVNVGNDFKGSNKKSITNGDLKGIGCCAGVVKGRVKVIHHPDEIDSLNGDILVTSSTDPGWVTLFPTAAAILVERGSLLSHSAIVSREMGIPCIVGISNLLQILKSGDLIEMDGRSGVVKIITV
jgi:phosphohistidine swiveling domain-containing protein